MIHFDLDRNVVCNCKVYKPYSNDIPVDKGLACKLDNVLDSIRN